MSNISLTREEGEPFWYNPKNQSKKKKRKKDREGVLKRDKDRVRKRENRFGTTQKKKRIERGSSLAVCQPK